MNMAAILQILRALLIAIGGAMTQRGWVDDATVQWVVGAVITLTPIVWGLWVQRPAGKIKAIEATGAVVIKGPD